MNQDFCCSGCQTLFPARALGHRIYAVDGAGRQLCWICISLAIEEAERRWLNERLQAMRREEQW